MPISPYKKLMKNPNGEIIPLLVKTRQDMFTELNSEFERLQEVALEKIAKICDQNSTQAADFVITETQKIVADFKKSAQKVLMDFIKSADTVKRGIKKGDKGDSPTFDDFVASLTEEQQKILRGDNLKIPKAGVDFFTQEEQEGFMSKVVDRIKNTSGKYPDEKKIRRIFSEEIDMYFIKNPDKIVGKKEVCDMLLEHKPMMPEIEVLADNVARALEKAPVTKKLDYEKGLKNKPSNLSDKSPFGSTPKGGGIGDVQHESKSVSSATTTITTNYKIAGSGYALWAYYQGQLIVRGTHYTVAGDYQTITLSFTPQDSTTIDLIYFR